MKSKHWQGKEYVQVQWLTVVLLSEMPRPGMGRSKGFLCACESMDACVYVSVYTCPQEYTKNM